MRKWILFAVGAVLIAAGSFVAARTQTIGGIRIEDIRFAGTGGAQMSALLYVPPGASAAKPAPGILAVHGYINSREMQDGFAIEFARRGYVVLALDQTGHGYSAPPAFANGFGGPDGLKYLRSLPFVDKDNIGLEGHSLGGATVLLAAKAYPNDYRAIILVGSTTSPPAAGTTTFPRNAAFVLGQYDEFLPQMWGGPGFVTPMPVEKFLAKDVGGSTKMKTIFGAQGAVTPGVVYGDIGQGMGRELYQPAVTHPGEHISTEAIGDATDWFAQTLKGGTPRSDQVWYWKEFGTLVAFAGFVVLLLGAFEGLLALPFFAALISVPTPQHETRDGKWWRALIAAVLVPGIGFFPFMIIGSLIPANAVLTQGITTQVLLWALGTALIGWVIRLGLKARDGMFNTQWLPSLAMAVAVVGIGYVSLMIVDAVFHTDYRFWIIGVKLMSAWQFKAFLIYLLPFTAYFLSVLKALHSDLAVKNESWLAQYTAAKTVMAGGIFLILLIDYVPLATSDHLLLAVDPLHAIIGIQFIFILALVAFISVFTYRRTNSYVPGALICSLFVTWYVVAGTATMA